MGKYLVYISMALAIIVVMCSIVSATTGNNVSIKNQDTPVSTNEIHINQNDVSTTTNIWDYIRSQNQDDATVGDSNSSSSDDNNSSNTELTITLK